MYKKIVSLAMVGVMAVVCASCNAAPEQGEKEDNGGAQSQQLEILRSDATLSQDQLMSRIKAEYLLEHGGYSDSDKVSAIIRLPEASLIDTFTEGKVKAQTLAGYADTVGGRAQADKIARNQNALIAQLYEKGLIGGVNYTYSAVINAVSVETTYADFKKIERLDNVDTVVLSDTFNRPQTATDVSAIVNDVDVYETGIFNSGSVPYTGKGTAVAVLDSGFDCSHSVFANQPEDLWITRDDVTGVLAETNAARTTAGLKLSDVWYSSKIPFVYDYADKDNDVFPYDSEHGTHVAGIIGGKDAEITGVAVDTQLVLLKVFPDLDDGAHTEDILAALEDAVLLGVDAINLSLGSSCGFSREADGDVINEVYDRINESGISLITAASNSYSSSFGGEQGNTNFVTNPDSGTVGSPSTYAASLSVASISGTKSRYLLGNGEQVIFFTESNSVSGDANDFVKELGITEGKKKTYEYVTVPGVGLRVNYASLGDITGKIALVKRGDNTFEEKAEIAKSAGAAGCIIWNNIDGDIVMSMGKSDHIPTISISKDAGTILASRSGGTLTVDFDYQAGPFMSDFSSWGPTPNLELKPEITAHGGNIRSSVPGGGYDNISGTSMASPNMCGIVVLIRQYLKNEFPTYSAKEICVLANRLLMSTASIILNEEGNPYSPRKQGAGLASLFNVVNTRAYLTVDGAERTKIELKDDPDRNGVYTLNFNVVNMSDAAAEYKLSLTGMTETVSSSDPKHVAETGRILDGGYRAEISGGGTLNGDIVTVGANETAKLKVTYTLTDGDKSYMNSLFPYGMYVEGFAKLTAVKDGDIDLNVPFLAFFGDWTQAPMFDKTYYEVESEAHNAAIDEEDKLKADYFATTPYGSYFYNYIVPLGTYLYEVDESMYDPIAGSREHIAISNILGTIDGISSVYTGLLRNAANMTYSITDKVSGEVVWSLTEDKARKAHSLGGNPIPYSNYLNLKTAKLNLINNRKYAFEMKARLDYGDGGETTNVRNSFAFDFYMDDEAPILKSATYEKVYDKSLKKDRYYVTLTIYDNHYVQSVTPGIFISSSSYEPILENPVPVYGGRGQDNVVRIEITDYLEDLYAGGLVSSALAFSIDDYALNSNIYLCQLPGTRGDFKFTKDGTMDGGDMTVLTLFEDEVVDLTRYLATADSTVDANKDYLKHLVWQCSNEKVALVSEGQVLGLQAGRTMITVAEQMNLKKAYLFINVKQRQTKAGASRAKYALASSNDVGNVNDATIQSIRFSYFDTVHAYPAAGQVSKIGKTGNRIMVSSLEGGSVSFYPGEKIKLSYDLDPWYVAGKYELTYSSTNENVATVDADGVVTALKKGTATITLKVSGSNLMARIRVIVNSEFVIENRALVAYKGLGGDVVIPDDEGILYIGPYAFCLYETDRNVELTEDDFDANKVPASNSTITSVVIPKGVEDIQKYAFYNCTALTSVTVPDTVKYVRQYAFYNNSSLETINLKNVETVGREAFRGCAALGAVDVSKAYAIGAKAFQDCAALAYVDLTALRNSGAEIFRNCTALKSVKLGENTKLSNGMFAYSGLTEVTINEKVFVPDNCFYGCESLVKVTLPDNSFGIGANCFYGCASLKEIVFRDNTLFAAAGVLFESTALNKFTVPESCKNYSVSADGKLLLGKNGTSVVMAAAGASFGNYTLAEEYTEISDGAFGGTDIVTLTILNKDAVIRPYAFANCGSLKKVTFPAEGVAEIGARAFDNAKALERVDNLDKVKLVGDYAFASTAITQVTVAADASYGNGAFFRSKIVTLTITGNAAFGPGAFQRCVNLTRVNMPVDGTVEFGEGCFAYDTALSSIDLSKQQRIENMTFYGCTALVKAALTAATEIGDHAFADCSALYNVSMPKVVSIGESAFGRYAANDGGAPAISELVLPETLKYVGMGAFIGCEGLISAVLPSSLEEVSDYMFAYCINLEEVTLPETIKRIGVYGFAGSEVLNKINLGNVKEFAAYAFTSCGMLEQIDLTSAEKIGFGAFASTDVGGDIAADNLVSLGAYAFQNADITSFKADKLEEIGAAAFQYNKRLKSFVLSDKIKSVGSLAFNACTSLENFLFVKDGKQVNGGKVNDYALLDDGILYTYMPSGRLQLTSVPAGKSISTLEVLEGTYRIDMYAGNENAGVSWIVLPDSLKLIGNYAFYGYKNLGIVEFKSYSAPALENSYNKDAKLDENDPGYGLLHDSFDVFGYELCYYNFKDLAGKNAPVSLIIPDNADETGYGALIYEAYFGKVENARRSGYTAKDKNLSEFIDYAEELAGKSVLTIADETLINNAVTAMNALKQSGTDYGYSAENWQKLIDTVNAAKAKLGEIRLMNAGIKIRNLQERINALPETYNGEGAEMIEALKAEIEALDREERNLLDLTKYENLLRLYEQYVPVEEEEGGNIGLILAIVIPCAAVCIAAAAGAAIALRKRARSKK